MSVLPDVAQNMTATHNNFPCCQRVPSTVTTTLSDHDFPHNGLWLRTFVGVCLQRSWQPAARKEQLRVIAAQLLASACADVCVCVCSSLVCD